jgi:hypothetical protein
VKEIEVFEITEGQHFTQIFFSYLPFNHTISLSAPKNQTIRSSEDNRPFWGLAQAGMVSVFTSGTPWYGRQAGMVPRYGRVGREGGARRGVMDLTGNVCFRGKSVRIQRWEFPSKSGWGCPREAAEFWQERPNQPALLQRKTEVKRSEEWPYLPVKRSEIIKICSSRY